MHDFFEDALGRACDACVVEQVTHLVVRMTEESVGQPSDDGPLAESTFSLQEFNARQDASVLVLPATTCGEQLFEDEGTIANLELVPSESAKIG